MQTTSGIDRFSITTRLRSFKFALNGITSFFKQEHNAWIHLLVTITVISFILIIPCSKIEIVMLVLAMGLVWVAEIFNTAIERFADIISPETNPKIKFIKDVSAAAVLVAALCALIIGCIIFIPKFF